MNDSNYSWAWVLSVVVVILALGIFFFSPNVVTAGNIGDFLSGFASALAFIWLIAAFFQQRSELNLQRKELKLQREALELQHKDLNESAKHAALSQIATMLHNFKASLPDKKIQNVSTPEDISQQLIRLMETWKTILESTSDQAVIDRYQQWALLEGIAYQFLSVFVLAVRIYAETTGKFSFKESENDASFILSNSEILQKIPHIQQYFLSAYAVANQLTIIEPGLKKVRLAGFSAMNRVIPGSIRQEAILELEEEIRRFRNSDSR